MSDNDGMVVAPFGEPPAGHNGGNYPQSVIAMSSNTTSVKIAADDTSDGRGSVVAPSPKKSSKGRQSMPVPQETTEQQGAGKVDFVAENGEIYWVVKHVLEHRVAKRKKQGGGKTYDYRVEWEDWPKKDLQWYPEENLNPVAKERYWERQKAALETKQPAAKRRKTSNGSKTPTTTRKSQEQSTTAEAGKSKTVGSASPKKPTNRNLKKKVSPAAASKTDNQKSYEDDDDNIYEVEEFLEYRRIDGVDKFRIKWRGYEKYKDKTWYGMDSFIGDTVNEAKEFKTKMLRSQLQSASTPTADDSTATYRIPVETLERRLLKSTQCPVCCNNFSASIESKHCPIMSQG
ncbi:expressed unknown protein [Seminavis robusta]|uniref:Chromo domain-containing protein n=1 Tax=Seminavis robusta TaxID=568900 RepID=A0A9N8HAJ6_9STRA|nr:expressed unknown protein [Seminavis robusta]|eukprot:Sro227_g092470.1 n/a (345) ;mRNA; f:85604-86801